TATELFDERRFGQSIARIIAAFDEDMWTNRLDQAVRRVVLERDNVIDTVERGQHLNAVFKRIDRPLGAFEPADALVAVHADDEYIAQSAGLIKVCNVSTVKNVKAAVGQ